MKRFTFAVVCLSGFVIGPACQAIVGIEDRSEAPAEDAAALADGAADDGPMNVEDAGSDCAPDQPCLAPDAAPALDCPGGCLPGAPLGWSGPTAVYDGAEVTKPTDCPATFTKKAIETHVGVIGGDATCSCGPPELKDRFCQSQFKIHDLSDCSDIGVISGTLFSVGDCFPTPDPGQFGYFRLATPLLYPGSCSFPDASTTVPAPVFTKVQVACDLAQKDACPTRPECIAASPPTQPFERLCIYKDGYEQCPSEDYAQRFYAFKKVDDTRGCTACTATVSDGGCGTSFGTSATTGACATEAPATNAVPGCYPDPGKGTLLNGHAMAPAPATCTVAGGTPAGTAKSAEPVTFCCRF